VSLDPYRPDHWPVLITAAEIAEMLRVEQNTVSTWCNTGRLDGTKVGREWRIPAEAVWPLLPLTIRQRWPDGPWREISIGPAAEGPTDAAEHHKQEQD
jgi:excisionase family DNA binding protein